MKIWNRETNEELNVTRIETLGGCEGCIFLHECNSCTRHEWKMKNGKYLFSCVVSRKFNKLKYWSYRKKSVM